MRQAGRLHFGEQLERARHHLHAAGPDQVRHALHEPQPDDLPGRGLRGLCLHVRRGPGQRAADEMLLVGRAPGLPNRAMIAASASNHSRLQRQVGLHRHAEKYLASGWNVIRASVDCSGSSWNSSDRATPIRSGRRRRMTLARSSRSGQAGYPNEYRQPR